MPRIITRHANRKLYDSQGRRYVSLAEIADLVIGGDSVRVVEHPSGLDATPRILAQTMVDLVKRRAQSLPVELMETLVRLAGGSKAVAGGTRAETPAPIREFTDRARKEAEAIATRLVRRGRLGIEEALHLRKEVEVAIHRGFQAAEAATRRPADALRPGPAVHTIAGLAEELKALEALVAKPSRATQPISPPAPGKTQAPRKKSSRKRS